MNVKSQKLMGNDGRTTYELHEPENVLAKKAVVDDGEGMSINQMIQHAQDTVDQMSEAFIDKVNENLKQFDEMLTECERACAHDNSTEVSEEMIEMLEGLRAAGGTFGFPLISEMGRWLISFLENVGVVDARSLPVMRSFHDSMRAVMVYEIRNESDPGGKDLVDGLFALMEKRQA